MKLQVSHRTRYEYAGSVRESFNEVRLRPMTNEHQTCESFHLDVQPAARISQYSDFHKNTVHFFELPDSHGTLLVDSKATVSTSSLALTLDATPAPMSALPDCVRMDRCFDFLQESTFVERSPEAWRLALDLSHDHADVWQAAQAIMRHIHKEFAYTPSATGVHTHMRDVLRDRKGVCQDFAHVMCGLCRALQIPALYVSGYLYNGPRDQLLGAQASHAWCEVFLPGLGWRGLDPTNCQPADERYIKLAVGRDYADVPPVRGHYKGTTQRTMDVEVLVERLDG